MKVLIAHILIMSCMGYFVHFYLHIKSKAYKDATAKLDRVINEKETKITLLEQENDKLRLQYQITLTKYLKVADGYKYIITEIKKSVEERHAERGIGDRNQEEGSELS